MIAFHDSNAFFRRESFAFPTDSSAYELRAFADRDPDGRFQFFVSDGWHTSCPSRRMAKFRRKENEQEPQQGTQTFAGDSTAAETDRELIAQRAYELYVERGGGEGQDLDDWLSAERELTGSTRGSSDEP